MKYINFKTKDKKLVLEFDPSFFRDLIKNKIFITIVILIVVSLSLFYTFRAYYYTHWYVVYYGKSENFEAEVVAVPAIIEKKTLKSMKEMGDLTRVYHKELWIKCDKPEAPFLPPCEKVIFDLYSKDFVYTP